MSYIWQLLELVLDLRLLLQDVATLSGTSILNDAQQKLFFYIHDRASDRGCVRPLYETVLLEKMLQMRRSVRA